MTVRRQDGGDRLMLWIGFALFCAVAIGLVGRDLDRPGIYYDEVIQAEPSIRFLTADPSPHTIPGASQIRVASRWFPVMTQPYMGALKSQLLIPFLAIFGTSPASLRLTTLAWSLTGVLLMMMWARGALGLAVALIAGALVVLDPSFLFVSRHDWGSFSLGFVCRCGALLLLANAFSHRETKPLKLAAGGLLLGLGIYNKIDFGVALVAAMFALLAVRPQLAAEFLASPRRATWIALGAVVGAGPLLATLPQTLAAARGAISRPASGSDFDEKWNTLASMLDGSHFHELMLSGGEFKAMLETDGTASLFTILFSLSLLWVGIGIWRGRKSSESQRTRAFVALCCVLIPLATLVTPRAIRIHHALLVVPFPQLLVAIAAVDLWKSPTAQRWMRVAATLVVATAIVGSLRVDLATMDMIRETHGRGRWSDAIGRFSTVLKTESRSPEANRIAVSLDWGIHLPLRFADRSTELIEPIWKIGAQLRAKRPWSFDGDERHVYLFFEPQFAVFPYGQQFLEAARRLPEGRAVIRHHPDASGDPVFVSVRLLRPHRLRYTGRFQIQ